MRHTKHLWRAGIAIVLFICIFMVIRYLNIPASWGLYGFYRADNVAEQMDKPIRYGGRDSCSKCHEKEKGLLANDRHAGLSCESCHAPLSSHVFEGKRIAPMAKNKTYAICLRCHEKLVGRPAEFPQIVLKEHIEEMGAEFKHDVCFNCHNPHSPKEGL